MLQGGVDEGGQPTLGREQHGGHQRQVIIRFEVAPAVANIANCSLDMLSALCYAPATTTGAASTIGSWWPLLCRHAAA